MSDSQNQIKIIYTYFAKGEFDKCIVSAQEFLKSDENNGQISKVLAGSYVKTGQFQKALDIFEKLAILEIDDPSIFLAIGQTYNALGNIDLALKNLNAAHKLSPDSYELKLFYAILLLKKNYKTECEKILSEAVELDGSKTDALNFLASLYYGMSRHTEAIENYEKSLTIDRTQIDVLYNVAECYFSIKQMESAKNYYEKALAINPNYSHALTLKGKLHFESGQMVEAKEVLSKVYEFGSHKSETLLFLSMLEILDRKLVQARKFIEEALKLDKSDKIAHVLQIMIEESLKSGTWKFSKLTKQVEYQLVKTHLEVQKEVLQFLITKHAVDLNAMSDPSYGSAKGSDYSLFNDPSREVNGLELALNKVLTDIFNRPILISNSFYSIFKKGGGTKAHVHLDHYDTGPLNLEYRKFSLVYYLKKGDQSSSNPGYLELFSPSENFLPTDGSIVIFPASRPHQSFYDGASERVLVGLNFYVT